MVALVCALTKVGFRAVGVDWKNTKDKNPVAKVQWMDLGTRAGKEEFYRLLETPGLVYVHFAPPCNTASRARQVRIKQVGEIMNELDLN